MNEDRDMQTQMNMNYIFICQHFIRHAMAVIHIYVIYA